MRGPVCVAGCVLITSSRGTIIWTSGLYIGKSLFLMMETGIKIRSRPSAITHNGNSSTAAFFPGLVQRPEERWWNTFTPWHIRLPFSLTHLYLCSCLNLSPSFSSQDFLPLLYSSTCFLATELTCPLFSAQQICCCNPRFYGTAHINHRSPRGAELCSMCLGERLPRRAVNLVSTCTASFEW